MSKRLITVFSLFFLLVFSLNVSAQETDIPEKNGTYDVPGHKNLKVRVFVHNAPTQSPALVTCSVDNNSNSVDGTTGWHLPTGTWNYKLNSSSAPNSVGSANLSTIANNAFTQWQNVIGSKVTFHNDGTTSTDRNRLDGVNLVAWGRTQGSALAVTYTWFNSTTNTVVENDTIFNKKFAWGWSTNTCNSSYYDAQDILTHETGHWVGLDDEYTSAYIDNTMYGYGSKGEIKKDTLTTGDVSTASSLY